MMVDIPVHVVDKLRTVLNAMDSAYKEHGTTLANENYAMYFDTPETASSNADPIEYTDLNRGILQIASEIKTSLKF